MCARTWNRTFILLGLRLKECKSFCWGLQKLLDGCPGTLMINVWWSWIWQKEEIIPIIHVHCLAVQDNVLSRPVFRIWFWILVTKAGYGNAGQCEKTPSPLKVKTWVPLAGNIGGLVPLHSTKSTVRVQRDLEVLETLGPWHTTKLYEALGWPPVPSSLWPFTFNIYLDVFDKAFPSLVFLG